MPYSISHVAAAVPIARRLAKLGMLSAFVIGSMVPDFSYLLPIQPARFLTHSAPALVTFCLPVGLFWYWVFQRLMKTPLMSVLPDQAYMRWLPYSAPARWRGLRQWLLAACGVLTGAVVHLAWDAFSHEDARGVRMLPELRDPQFELHGHVLTGARLIQDLSSVLGLLLVIAAIAYALRGGRATVTSRVLTATERRKWVVTFAVATILFSAIFLFIDHDRAAYQWIGGGVGVGSMAIALLRGLVFAAVGVSLLLRRYLRTRTPPVV